MGDEAVLRAVLAGFPDRVAKRRELNSRRAIMVGGRGVRLADSSAVDQAELFVCLDVEGSQGATVASTEASTAQALEHRALIQFSADEDFLTLIERVRSAASHRLSPNATLEQVFALVMNEYVKREDPAMRHERREAKKSSARFDSKALKSPRQIPARVWDQVFVRDRGRCTYVSPDGQRCDAARFLQVDHIQPVARGGGATVGNLRLLCAHHNRLEAERLMGVRNPPQGMKELRDKWNMEG